MSIKSVVRSTTTMPDDQIEEDREVIKYAGEGVSEVIAGWLRAAGYTVSALDNLDFVGWEFTADAEGRTVLLRVTDIGEVYVVSVRLMAIFKFLKANKAFLAKAVQVVHDGLTSDPRFSAINWFAPREFHDEEPGAPEPVS